MEKTRFLVTLPTSLVRKIESRATKRRSEIRKASGAGKFFRNDMIVELLEKGLADAKATSEAA